MSKVGEAEREGKRGMEETKATTGRRCGRVVKMRVGRDARQGDAEGDDAGSSTAVFDDGARTMHLCHAVRHSCRMMRARHLPQAAFTNEHVSTSLPTQQPSTPTATQAPRATSITISGACSCGQPRPLPALPSSCHSSCQYLPTFAINPNVPLPLHTYVPSPRQGCSRHPTHLPQLPLKMNGNPPPHANGSNGSNASNTTNASNGRPQNASMLTPLGLNRSELVRIIVQAVDTLGYPKSARTLEHEAGFEAMAPEMRTLRDCILNGRWDDLEAALDSLTVFKSDDDARAARFVLYEQKFLELLEAGRTAEALNCLRNHLTRLCPDRKLLDKLPLLCLCATPQEVREHADWPGAGPASRTAVLEKLHRYIPPTHLLQENRLENLLCQTIEQQKRVTMYPYTRQLTISLLEDMEHCQERVPRHLLHTLGGHTDEVWYVQFSHAGEFLASASKDATVIVWKIRALLKGECTAQETVLHKLQGHTRMICLLSWSPDDTRLLSCGSDRAIRLWSIESGECVRLFEGHIENISACVWMPNGVNFVSGAYDCKIIEWDANTGQTVSTYAANHRVNDVVVSKDGSFIIATCADKSIQIFDTTTKAQVKSIVETVSATSLFLSPDNDSLLVCTNSGENPEMEHPEIHVWSIREARLLQTFRGYSQQRFVIRGCFGGHNEMLVICGSEDKLVYIWERRSGSLIAKLDGHSGTVNTVACCEADENLLASCSDDKTIIVCVEPTDFLSLLRLFGVCVTLLLTFFRCLFVALRTSDLGSLGLSIVIALRGRIGQSERLVVARVVAINK